MSIIFAAIISFTKQLIVSLENKMTFKVESYKRGIAISTLYNVINKGLVFLSSIIVAYYFGTQIKTDIYFYAYNTIIIFSAFITSLNASVLIPESMRLRIQQGELPAMQFLNYFFYLYILLTVIICVILFLNPVKAFIIISDFPEQSLQNESAILLLATPLILLIPAVNLLTDILTSHKFFSIPMVAGIINGVFSILFLFLFHSVLGIFSLLTGLIISYVINFIILVILMKKKLHWQFRLKRLQIDKRIWKNIAFAQAGNITTSLSSYAPLYFLSGFSTGIITSLNFAQQLSSIPTTLITNQFSSVSGIKFNELYAKKEFSEISRVFLSTTSILLFILTPISSIFFLYSSSITSFLLERGAFEKSGVVYTSLFLQYMGLLLPMLAINTFVARLFMAGQKIMQSFTYQVAFNIVLIFFIWVGIQKTGITGYPLALITLHILNVLFCYILLKKFFPEVNYGKVLMLFLKIISLNFSILVLVLFVKDLLSSIPGIANLILGSMLYIMILLIVNWKIKLSPEINLLLKQLFAYTPLPRLNRKEP